MNLANRIQFLRKSRGLSQEELADRIGISRQAVSKWESGQSSPDLEKIILLSDFFQVTTDYILKGTEPVPMDSVPEKKKTDALIFSAIGTALNLAGIVISAAIWYEKQTAAAAAIGLLLLIIGYITYNVGMHSADTATVPKAKQRFRILNVWTLPFIPLSMGYNLMTGGKPTFAPYPVLVGSTVRYLFFWIIYFAIGILYSCITLRRKQD